MVESTSSFSELLWNVTSSSSTLGAWYTVVECGDVWIYTMGNVGMCEFIPWGMRGIYDLIPYGSGDVWPYPMGNVGEIYELISWGIWGCLNLPHGEFVDIWRTYAMGNVGDIAIYELIQWGCIKLSYEECGAYINLCHGDCWGCMDLWTWSEEITFKLLLPIMTHVLVS